MYSCSKEKEIEKLNDAVFGNGADGLLEDIKIMKADIKCLLHFQTQTVTKEEERKVQLKELNALKEREEKNRKWLIRLVVSTFLAISGLAITVLIAIFTNLI